MKTNHVIVLLMALSLGTLVCGKTTFDGGHRNTSLKAYNATEPKLNFDPLQNYPSFSAETYLQYFHDEHSRIPPKSTEFFRLTGNSGQDSEDFGWMLGEFSAENFTKIMSKDFARGLGYTSRDYGALACCSYEIPTGCNKKNNRCWAYCKGVLHSCSTEWCYLRESIRKDNYITCYHDFECKWDNIVGCQSCKSLCSL